MAVCDKWVALKIVEFLFCAACLVTKRVSADDEVRLSLLLQKLSREWSLLTSVTWDSVGGAFADAIYGGYVIITFGLIVARIFQEIPKGRRILEGIFLGFGMLFFIILGGLELASLDSVPKSLVVNASVLGAFSLVVAALFLIDLMGPRVYSESHHTQTDPSSTPKLEKKLPLTALPSTNGHNGVATHDKPNGNGHIPNDKKNGHLPPDRPKDLDLDTTKGHPPSERPKDLDLERNQIEKSGRKDDSMLFDDPRHGYTKFDDVEDILEKTRFGSLRSGLEGGNYVRLSDPLMEPNRLHYEQELAKFNEKYLREYLDSYDGGKVTLCKEDYLPELQTPVFAKVKTGRLKSLYDDVSPTYEQKRQSKSPSRAKTVPTPTLQQLEDYLRSSSRSRRGDTPLFPMEPIEEKEKESHDTDARASGTPTDPGYVQYTAGKWPNKREIRTPRHSPT